MLYKVPGEENTVWFLKIVVAPDKLEQRGYVVQMESEFLVYLFILVDCDLPLVEYSI